MSKPIHIAKSHHGMLHKALGIAQGQPISQAKLSMAKKSSDMHVREMATFAMNARGWDHK